MSGLVRIWRWLAAAALVVVGRRRERHRGRAVPPPADHPVAARAVTQLLTAASFSSIGFIVAYLLDAPNPLLGLSIGGSFAFLSAAAITASRWVAPQEESEEELGPRSHPEARAEVEQIVQEGGEGFSRRRLLVAATAGSVGLTGAALVLPAASLGPLVDTDRLRKTPWRAGRRLVDKRGAPISADDIELGSFLTAFPQGANPRALDASVIVVRVRPDELRLPPGRASWAPEGILAYSKVCTHAACAVSLFDYPTYAPTSPSPRLVCPCHYSAFDPTKGGDVIAGPAGRPLPQLPLALAADRTLVARGDFASPPGPSWSGVRQ
jgi:ubiquinol-cytochrome c reductase iron-sulfur subunit